MKKATRNMFAYAKQPSEHPDSSKIFPQTETSLTGQQTIYRDIIEQMDTEHSNYINKLVVRNNREEQRNQEKSKSAKTSVAHERTKSYADILVGTPTNSKANQETGFSYRGNKKIEGKNLFFSSQNTPVNQKPTESKSIKSIDKQKNQEKQKQNNPFLYHLDSYLSILSTDRKNTEKKNGDRRTVLKSRDPSPNIKVLQKLQIAEKRVKELKLSNHILETENQKLKKNQKRLKIKTKQKMQQVVDYARQLTFELESERYERRKMEDFIGELQKKFSRIRPEKRTQNYRTNKIQDFLMLSESTDQQQFDDNIFQATEFRPKSINSRKTGKGSKQSRLTGLTREQISTYAEKQLQLSDQDSQSIGI